MRNAANAQWRGPAATGSRAASAGNRALRDPGRRRFGNRQLSDREVVLLGAIAYWCEGAKSKPYRRDERVDFINSDPGLIRLFLAFLDLAEIRPQQLRYRLHIHENG